MVIYFVPKNLLHVVYFLFRMYKCDSFFHLQEKQNFDCNEAQSDAVTEK